MTTQVVAILALAMLSCGMVQAAENNPVRKQSTPDQKPAKTFAVRSDLSKQENASVYARDEERARSTEPEVGDYAMPRQIGSGPMAPLVCRHDDLSRDMEFRLCMQQLLEAPGSMRRSSE
jgi:hypothetical protein